MAGQVGFTASVFAIFGSTGPSGGEGGGGDDPRRRWRGGGGDGEAKRPRHRLSARPKEAWLVVQDTASISLAKLPDRRLRRHSLPGAGDFGAWRVGFDPEETLGGGLTMGETTGPDVAVCESDPKEAFIHHHSTRPGQCRHCPDANRSGSPGQAPEASPGSSGPTGPWYTPQDGLTQIPTRVPAAWTPAGVRTDSSGNIWIVGFRQSRDPELTNSTWRSDTSHWTPDRRASKPGYARSIGEEDQRQAGHPQRRPLYLRRQA